MQTVLQFVAASEDLKGLQSSRSNQRRNRVGEQVWTAALAEEVDNLLLARSEATYRTTEGFAQRTGDDLNFTTQVLAFGHAVTCMTYHTRRVALVHHHEGIVFLCQFVDFI